MSRTEFWMVLGWTSVSLALLAEASFALLNRVLPFIRPRPLPPRLIRVSRVVTWGLVATCFLLALSSGPSPKKLKELCAQAARTVCVEGTLAHGQER